MRKGFTLLELLGVIALLGILVLVSYPIVMEQIEKKQQEVNEARAQLIYSATDAYIAEHPEEYPSQIGNQYCISLDTLVDENKVAADVSDIKQRGVQVIMGSNHNITYRLVDMCE